MYRRTSVSPVWAALLLAALLACWPTASAHADAYTGAGVVQVKEMPPQAGSKALPGGSVSTLSTATSANGTFYCSVAYAAIQATPSSFVIGNCPQNTEVHRMMKSGLVDVGQGVNDHYEGGYILGPFGGCGWIRSAQSNANNTTTAWNQCDPNSIGYRQDEFMYRFASGQYYYDGCSGDASCAGTPVNNRQTCYTVANVRPWLSGQALPAPIRFIPANATFGTLPNGQPAPRLAWRYVTKYPTTDGTYWVMARDRALVSGQANWVFVPLSCL
jgi:hypothetical protein